MNTSIAIAKTGTLYAAYSPEFGVFSYGGCRDEAINNLAEDIRQYKHADTSHFRSERAAGLTGYERNQA